MPAFNLLQADGSTVGLAVVDVGNLFGARVRSELRTSPTGEPYAVGDGVELAQALSFTVRINEATEAAAYEALSALYEAARTAAYLTQGTPASAYRALQSGNASAGELNPEPQAGLLTYWRARLTLLPMFPLWTVAQVGTLSAYESARAAGEVLL